MSPVGQHDLLSAASVSGGLCRPCTSRTSAVAADRRGGRSRPSPSWASTRPWPSWASRPGAVVASRSDGVTASGRDARRSARVSIVRADRACRRLPLVVVGRGPCVVPWHGRGRRRALRRGGRRALDRRGGRRARSRCETGTVRRLHRTEPQLGGLADEALGLGRVLHARQVDDDRVALALHVGLGDAETVDAVADDVDRGVERRSGRSPSPGASTIEMPPWRSRPSTGRLSESSVATNVPTITTTVTISMMTWRRTVQPAPLASSRGRRRAALGLGDDLPDRAAGDVDHRAGRDLEIGVVVAEPDDPAVDPAGGEDVVALLAARSAARAPRRSAAAAGARAAGRRPRP